MFSTPLQRNTAFEALWAEIKLLVEWQRGFGFYLLFGDDARAADQLRQRLADATRLRTRELQWVRPHSAELVVDAVLQAAFPEGEGRKFQEWGAPLWLDLSAGPADSQWQTARRQALAALNQRRSALEQACTRPLLLQLPLPFASEVVSIAPDLWSVRQWIAVLPVEADGGRSASASPEQMRQTLLQLDAIAKVEMDAGHLAAALQGYQESLALCRQLRSSLGDTPQVLRDLSVSLNKLGGIQQNSGRSDAALAAYEESLALCRQLRSSLGDTPQVLRDLSVSLDKVGGIQQSSGRSDAALAAFEESLALCRQLRSSLGDTPQVLRDLSVSLDKVAKALAEAGRTDEASPLLHERQSLQMFLQALDH